MQLARFIIPLCILLSACTSVGHPGSPIWKMTTSQQDQDNYYRNYAITTCQHYSHLNQSELNACIDSFEKLPTVHSMAEERQLFLKECEQASSSTLCVNASDKVDEQLREQAQQAKIEQLKKERDAAVDGAAYWQFQAQPYK